MKVLIIGGTQFVGKYVAEAADKAGHQVTLFNRGLSNPTFRFENIKGDVDTFIWIESIRN